MPGADPRSTAEIVEELLEKVRKLPILDSRTDDEIIGYDDDGLPT